MSRGNSQSAWRVFRWPLWIGLASIAGLISALLGDGWADALSWILLGALPVLLVVLYLRSGRRS